MSIVHPPRLAGEALADVPMSLRLWAATIHVDCRLVEVERLVRRLAVGRGHCQYHRRRAILRRRLERVVGPAARHEGLRDPRLLAECWSICAALWARSEATR